jgi:hypothetical protein
MAGDCGSSETKPSGGFSLGRRSGRLRFLGRPRWLVRRSRCRPALDRGAQRVHQIVDVAGGRFLRNRDRLALLFFLKQLLQCRFVVVLKFRGIEMPRFGLDNMLG